MKKWKNYSYFSVPNWGCYTEPHLSFLLSLSSDRSRLATLSFSSVIDTEILHVSMYGGHFSIQYVILIVFDKLNYMICRWMNDSDGCTATDAVLILLQACINLSMWLRQTNMMVLCLVHVWTVGTLMSTLPREPFKATCFGEVSCPAIIVGPSTEKEGDKIQKSLFLY